MINATVEIQETSIHTFHIDNVASPEEAVDIAQEKFDDGDEPDETELLDIEIEAFQRED